MLAPSLCLDIQRASQILDLPDDTMFQEWVNAVLAAESLPAQLELCIRIVDEAEITDLNIKFRQRSGSTNILSFPAENIPEIPEHRLGDLIICAPVVDKQAQQQHKSIVSHWAHMVVHGVLHLCGYDHLNDIDSVEMEQREILILDKLGFSNPYEVK